MFVGVTGTLGSGKGEVVRILRKRGFTHYSFGDLLRAEATKRGQQPTTATLMAIANDIRTRHGPGYLAEQLLHRLEQEAPENAVLESIRNAAELQVLRRLPNLILLSVDAPRETRYERTKHRSEREGVESYEAFSELEDAQLEGTAAEQQLLAVMDEADVQIVNIGNLAELEAQLEEQLNL